MGLGILAEGQRSLPHPLAKKTRLPAPSSFMTLPIGLPCSTDKACIAGSADRYPEPLLHKSHDLARPINISFTNARLPGLLHRSRPSADSLRLVRWTPARAKPGTAVMPG